MLTPYQLASLRRLAQPYVEDLPEPRAIDNLILLFDVLETLELTVPQMTVIFGDVALTYVTELVYGEPKGRTPLLAVERPASA